MSSPAASGAGGAGARLTPYELALPAEEFEARIFPAVAAEARARSLDPALREHFHFLGEAAKALDLLAPEGAPAAVREQLRSFLYHAFNFWAGGRRLLCLEPALVRYLVESGPALSGWEPEIPGGACYLQLPANLFWAAVEAEAQAEPVDGIFVTAGAKPGSGSLGPQAIHALLVLGMRRERGGFSVVEVEAQGGPEGERSWLDAPARAEGLDFASTLPGGEMAGLYSLLTSAEVLKLVFRALRHVADHPEAVAARAAVERGEVDGPVAAPPSSLPWSSVRLEGGP
jgi:hypothetical protein